MSTLDFLWNNLPNLLFGFPNQRPGGLLLSVLISAAAVVFGLCVAIVVGTAGASRRGVLRRLSSFYVEVVRGLPLLLLLLLIHQGLGGRQLGLNFSPMTSTLIALTLYTSAYHAEVVRAGLQAVPKELVESARLLGASRGRTFYRIRLRYTFHKMLPGFVNETITLFKDSSVVVVLGVGELMTVARATLGSDIQNAAYWLPLYLLVGLLYAIVALGISRLAVYWEHRQNVRQMKDSWFTIG